MAGAGMFNGAIQNIARAIAEAHPEEASFYEKYRQVINEANDPQTVESMDINSQSGTGSNRIVFRNANISEATGLQKISLDKSNGGKEDIFLIVPARESVGYGNIRGWGSDKDQNMPLFKKTIEAASDAGRNSTNPGAKAISEGSVGILAPAAAAGDLVLGNTIANNVTKNANSKYTGEDKAVGLGNSGESDGQIFGMVTSDGEIMSPQETMAFLKNLKKNGYKGVSYIEKPKKVQEHTGPAYVPGDILLGFLGLQPNRGSVGYTFKTVGDNEEYKTFVENLRKSKGNK